MTMKLHFYQGESYSWQYANRTHDDSMCWEESMTGDEYEEWQDRRRFEQSNQGWR